MGLETDATSLIIGSVAIGLVWAASQFVLINNIKLVSSGEERGLTSGNDGVQTAKLREIYQAIKDGADAFLNAEYTICLVFIIVFGAAVFFLISIGQGSWLQGMFTTIAFVLGALTSILSGWIGMKVAVHSNVRTTIGAQQGGYKAAFNCAFRAGAVMGFALTSMAVLVLYIALYVYRQYFPETQWDIMMDCISGYGLGGSSIAMFGRVGGGIYTKAADVGADLVGKVVHGIPEDDPRNPATIADNVGDNVGDVAGMGADLFGSYAESTCAALVIAATCPDLVAGGWGAMVFPMEVSAAGILVCLVSSFLATHIRPVHTEPDIESALKLQLIVTTILIIPVTWMIAHHFLPAEFVISGVSGVVTSTPYSAFVCVSSGAVGGLVIGLITEYYTSHSYAPVREVALSCKTGSATNIIYGLSLGYKSVIIPVFVLAAIIYTSFGMCETYGVALAAIGMLSTLATGLTIDAYGPVCDNAGGIAEMCQLAPSVREKTDALDAAGNTTAAVGKGFAIGSAALVSLALYGAFVTRLGITDGVNILEPLTFSFLLIGAMLPYWFSAMTMKAVGTAAMEMVQEVQQQFEANPRLLDEDTTERPDYQRCIAISTRAALKYMLPPGALVMLAPLVAGTLFGVYAVCGLLTGGMASGVQVAISMSNTGGAWDNAKKYVEKATPESELRGKGSDIHKAAVVGDTVGDPLKDTSGPSLNILMKLSAIVSLVFAEYFMAINDGHGLFNVTYQS
ncbi:inorganic pyrophosphatase [Tribonema minus]|uniref:H(+)-exporting diphosphatase n=1 Tax=Tribonema minus TaxID=303371 RepID=A0A835YSH3_9STRA|nr:inorganic pyrophosphatase [Tribonema minus]